MLKSLIKILFISLLCSSISSAYRCHLDRCTDLRVGVGSYYGNFNTHYGNTQDIGGIVSLLLEAYYTYFHIGSDIDFIYAYQKSQGFDAQTFGFNASYYTGINVNSFDKPFLIDFVMPIDYYDFGLATKYRERQVQIYFGGRIYQRIPINETHQLEYALSYAVSPFTKYIFEDFENQERPNNHRIELSFGYIHRRDVLDTYGDRLKSPDFYTRIKAIYYRQNALKLREDLNYPSGNNFAVMLEVGLSFDATY